VAGFTDSYPGTPGAFQVSAPDSTGGCALSWLTHFSGSAFDNALGIAIDHADDVFITGVTFSSDLPMVSPEQPPIGGSNQSDAYLAKFSPDVPPGGPGWRWCRCGPGGSGRRSRSRPAYRVVSLMSREAADELAPGVMAVASVKSTSVVVEIPPR
jgi:hypothetical protein